MNLTIAKIKNFFRKKFNIVKARTAIAGIKGLIKTYKNAARTCRVEIDKLEDQASMYRGLVLIYEEMLEKLKDEL